MTTESKNDNKSKKLDKETVSKEFAKIITGLERSAAKIAEGLKQRVGPGDWKLWTTNCKLNDGQDQIDLVFKSPEGRKDKYIIVDVSVPHLQIGQKYSLPAKAKLFQSKYKVTTNRLKKAIILVRKGTETISTRPLRIRCPIIELQYEHMVKEPRQNQQSQQKQQKPSSNRGDNTRDQKQSSSDRHRDNRRPATEKNGVNQELLFALKEAIVHECLSTMHKRHNKYVCKGLWRWIDREIMDPNVHFYLVILSSIYQGKTGDVLSRKFKTCEEYSNAPEEVISAIFSRENNLADEIKKSSERHKKALKKFLACFGQTPPFEYLRSLFLKEFRSTADGLKSRMSVFATLNQLLERCGFEGEKETQYPLEILDELGIFKGIMTGNYARLRTDNASKKLKHLVPDINWTEDDIYQLRNQLAKALNLPSQEFNLNAFLPQAFLHDAKHLAESRKEAIRAPVHNKNQQPVRQQPAERPARDQRIEQEKTTQETRERPVHVPQEKTTISEAQSTADNRPRERSTREATDRRRFDDCDESKHRFFENFGGHEQEDSETVRLALAMVRSENEKKSQIAAPVVEEIDEDMHTPPTKQSNQHYTANHIPPKKRPASANSAGSSSGNTRNRNDKRRRYSKNQNRRNKPQRPSGNGASR